MLRGHEDSLDGLIRQEFLSIPQPRYLSTLFTELPVVMCRPLDAPLDDFAITHHGVVFQARPLHTVTFGILSTIHPGAVAIPKYNKKGEPYICLTDRAGRRHVFLVARLVLDRFFGVSLTDAISIEYVDGDPSNVHYLNLVATYKTSYREVSPWNRRIDAHEVQPLH